MTQVKEYGALDIDAFNSIVDLLGASVKAVIYARVSTFNSIVDLLYTIESINTDSLCALSIL